MKRLFFSVTVLVTLISIEPSMAQKFYGKCMRPDCASMLAYCQESKSTGKTSTNCETAAALCAKNKKWVGTTPDGKKWACGF